MTMQALPKQPEAWRPTPGYSAAALREDSEAKALKAINDASDDYWADWHRDCDSLMVLMYPTPRPAERLVRYQNKPVQEMPPVPPMVGADEKGEPVLIEQPQPMPTGSWMGQKIDFPEDYSEDMRDWVQLEPVSPRRDQVQREIAGLEMYMAAEEAAMSAPPALPALPPPTSGIVEDLPDVQWSGA